MWKTQSSLKSLVLNLNELCQHDQLTTAKDLDMLDLENFIPQKPIQARDNTSDF